MKDKLSVCNRQEYTCMCRKLVEQLEFVIPCMHIAFSLPKIYIFHSTIMIAITITNNLFRHMVQ